MKIHHIAKKRLAAKPRYTIQYEPDFDHEAWQGEVEPSPEIEPDAFCKTYVQITPVSVTSERKQPHIALSIRQLRKRLHAAGLRGDRLNQVAHEIKAGPQILENHIGDGLNYMGWPKSLLLQKFGRRITKAVTRFVRGVLVMADEFHHLVGSSAGFAEFVQRAMGSWRKTNSIPMEVTQSIDQLAAVS